MQGQLIGQTTKVRMRFGSAGAVVEMKMKKVGDKDAARKTDS